MSLSNAAIRAIAIRRSGQRAQPANDNRPSARVRGGARMMTTAELQACVDAGGFAEHAG